MPHIARPGPSVLHQPRRSRYAVVTDHVTVSRGDFVACYKAPAADRYVIRDRRRIEPAARSSCENLGDVRHMAR